MPENEGCEGVVAALRRQHERIGEILNALHDGRWWPDDAPGSDDAAQVLAHARRIEECVADIARIVDAMKD
ncbi:hypothetical protein [Methylobacterium komagatae]